MVESAGADDTVVLGKVAACAEAGHAAGAAAATRTQAAFARKVRPRMMIVCFRVDLLGEFEQR